MGRAVSCGINSRSATGSEDSPPYGRLTRIADLFAGTLNGDALVNDVRLASPSFEEIYLQAGGQR